MHTNVLTVDGNEDVVYETGLTTSKNLYEDPLYNVTVTYINVLRKQPTSDYKLDVDF